MSNQFTAAWFDHEDRILKMYYGSRTYGDIAKLLKNRSKQAVKNRCKVLGLQTAAKRWTENELEILKSRYANDPHISELLPRWSWESIKHQANSMGLKVRYGTYKFDSEFFSKLTDESAYVVGFIAADGYLNLKANRIEIGLQASDRGHLTAISKAMGYTGPIYDKPATNSVRLQITSQKLLAEVIAILDVTSNKSLALEKANIPDQYMNSFIRGYVDGDGSIKSTVKSLRILGTETFLEWIDSNISRILGISRREPKRKGHENVFEIGYYGSDFLKVCSWMYTGSTIHLERKYQRYVNLASDSIRGKCSTSNTKQLEEDIVDSTRNGGVLLT